MNGCRVFSVGFLVALAMVCAPVPRAEASTAAFGGEVVEVDHTARRDTLARFTVRIDYLDYISVKGFGRDSKAGETITRRVMTRGTAPVLNSRLIGAEAFAKALRPGAWGYFYEDTWLDLFTTPDFQWGEIVAHDAAGKTFDLKVHLTDKDHHIEANPPVVAKVAYGDATAFRIEEKPADAASALVAGRWAQVHPPRGQIVAVRTAESAFDPETLPTAEEGKRGLANRLTTEVVMLGIETDNPGGFIDVGATIRARRTMGEEAEITATSRKVTFVLDGKVGPVALAARPGRHALLCYYRSGTAPHKVFVRSMDQAVRGRIKRVEDGALGVEVAGDDGKTREQRIETANDAAYQLDGQESTRDAALGAGRDVTVYPARGRTVIVFGAGS